MNYNSLVYFAKLAEMEHYTKAAQALYISQPSLSYAIAKLEEELGLPLFEKDGRNVRLTKYGSVFYEYVSNGLTTINNGIELAKQFSTAGIGTVNFAYLFILGYRLVPALIDRFQKINAYKDLHFVFSQASTNVIIDGLKRGIYDFGLGSFVDNEPDLIFTPVIRHRLILITPPDHPLTQRSEVHAQDLLDYPFIAYNMFTTTIRKMVDAIFEACGSKPQIFYEYEEESSIAAMVASGRGIAIVPEVAILNNYNIVKTALCDVNVYRELYLIRSKNRYLPASSEAFCQFIQNTDLSEFY